MTSTQEVQVLLRFLSQGAKVPLAQALGKVKPLQEACLVTASDISKANFELLKSIFVDEKVTRQVFNAAKRVSRKRASSSASSCAPSPSPKRAKSTYSQPLNPSEFEASLALPDAELNEEKLASVVIRTNRAPLALAFAICLLKYSMPEQPISSRLSLAQAVVAMNSKKKAIHVGMESGQAAEDEGWADSQPTVRIMTRDVKVMRRWGYEWEDSAQEIKPAEERIKSQSALWAVDLEAIKEAHHPSAIGSRKAESSHLPIYTAPPVKAYLLNSFDTPQREDRVMAVKRTNAIAVAEKERNLSLLLGALQLLYESWTCVLDKEDLDTRAWRWYVQIRPDVAQGAAGWGGKGDVKLSDILDLRRSPD